MKETFCCRYYNLEGPQGAEVVKKKEESVLHNHVDFQDVG